MNKDFLYGLALFTLATHSVAGVNSEWPCDFNLANQEAWIAEHSPNIDCASHEIILSLPSRENDAKQLSLSYNTKGELTHKYVQLESRGYHWSFQYYSNGALASMTYPSGTISRYAENSPERASAPTIRLANKHNLVTASDINPLYQANILASLPLATDEDIYRSTEILQDFLGIHLLDEYEYLAAFTVLKIRGMADGAISSYYAHFGPSMRLLALSKGSGEMLREFVYQSGELAYEVRHNTMLSSSAPETVERKPTATLSHKPTIVTRTSAVASSAQSSTPSPILNAQVSLDLSNEAFHERMAEAARNQTDSDNDGLPDHWEQLYFSSLDRDGRGDFDGDGRSDRVEFLRNSNPKLKLDGSRHRNTQSQLNALLHQI